MTNSPNLTILQGDVIEQLKTLPDESVQCVVTSPPYYGLRDYKTAQWEGGDPLCSHEVQRWDGPKQTQGAQSGHASKADRLSRRECACGAKRVDRQIGMEETPQEYVAKMVEVFGEVKRVLRKDGVCWLNLGDSYAANRTYQCPSTKGGAKHSAAQGESTGNRVPEGLKPKDLLMIPERVAMALQADGWYLRAKRPWIKRNAMPESVKDRPSTTVESIFMLTKNERYYYDAEGVKVASSPNPISAARRNRQDFGTVGTEGLKGDGKFGQSGQGDNAKYKAPTRTRRSSDWFFESWQGILQDDEGDPLAFVVNTKPYRAAHFATFPMDLVEPMIKAGSGERGCCSQCGQPWKRVLERIEAQGEPAEIGDDRKPLHASTYSRHKVKIDGGQSLVSGYDKTIEWKPQCSCVSPSAIPCTVLDPFGGSGTTAQVALNLGRRAILIELNADYLPLIRERCGLVASV